MELLIRRVAIVAVAALATLTFLHLADRISLGLQVAALENSFPSGD